MINKSRIPHYFRAALEQFHKEHNTEAYYKTQGFKKLWRYFKSIVETEDFQKSIIALRNKFKIPPTGFEIRESSWIHPPKEWKLYSPDWGQRMQVLSKVKNDLRIICKQYALPLNNFLDIVEKYLFYNRTFITLDPDSDNLCSIIDIKNGRDILGRQIGADDFETYPAALLISPYVSQRDIIDYVKKAYKAGINPLQKKYQKTEIMIGRVKKRNPDVKKRNDLIWSNREKSPKEIRELLWVELHIRMKSKHIAKVLNIEKRRRT